MKQVLGLILNLLTCLVKGHKYKVSELKCDCFNYETKCWETKTWRSYVCKVCYDFGGEFVEDASKTT